MAPLGHPLIARAFYALAFGGAVAALASDAQAQQQCGPDRQILGFLAQEYGERPVAPYIELGTQGALILMNPETGTWTILIQPQPGILCLVAEGDGIDEGVAL